jgi:hypothetical protein
MSIATTIGQYGSVARGEGTVAKIGQQGSVAQDAVARLSGRGTCKAQGGSVAGQLAEAQGGSVAGQRVYQALWPKTQ